MNKTVTLTTSTALALILGIPGIAIAQTLAGDAVTIPVGPNTEPETGPVNNSGFSLAIDGVAVDSDPQIEDRIRRTDIALAQADVQVTFDGLDPTPRLNLEIAGAQRAYGPGDTVTLRSETNYPAFISRGEFRIIDRSAAGGPRLVGTVPVNANGTASVALPAGGDLVAVHRVYDSRGRYDETEALPLTRADDRALSANPDGADFTAVRNMQINGGTITVAATSIAPGATLSTLGENVQADGSGRLVLQRILPAGDYDVDVSVSGGGQAAALSRPVTIPGAEWFYVAVADLTYGIYENSEDSGTETRSSGRLAFYLDGETDTGVQITASLDTGEQELDEIFSRLDEKDPRSVIARLDPLDSYPTFGDDSQIVDNTPTSGRFYLRVEQDGNFALWGDYKATIAGSSYLRNERSLYGAQLSYTAPQTTSRGDAIASVDLYAAQPEQLVGRDVFQGTGGSVYFLQRQDITIGSETLTVELRDVDTGRVIDRRTLVPGRDYDINYIQGVITLNSTLTDTLNPNLIQTNPGGDVAVNLVSQYEFTPTSTDVDGFSTGGRAEAWVTDNLRVGITAQQDDTGTADQTAAAVDLRYELGENTFVQLDYAESDGPGFGSSFSTDGGVLIDNTAANDGSGTAIKLAGQAALSDLGVNRNGVIGGYYEERTEGFSTLDYQVTDATGDETLYGLFARVEADERLGYGLYADVYENDAGNDKTEIGAEATGNINSQLTFTVAAEYLAESTDTTSGDRLDLAGRLTFAAREGLSYSIFGQTTADANGLEEFDRYGVGVDASIGAGWTIAAELSDGTGGIGGRILARQEQDENNATYFGYELDPGRAIDAGVSSGDNGGKYILGGRRQISDDVAFVGENIYDIFGTSRSLTSAYGVTYTATDFVTYEAALEFGQVEDSVNGDFDRQALSFGVRYEDEAVTGRARVEFRQEEASNGSTRDDLDAIYFSSDLRYKIDEEQRLVFSLDAARTDTAETSLLNGSLADASIGYAYRPIMDERLNVLARYRYLYDMFGQQIEGVAGSGPVQESHVFSIEGNYDLNTQWTLGAKVGGRFTESADEKGDDLVANDAWLAVVNARYNMVHNWDVLVEGRYFEAVDAEFTETGVLAAVYRHFGNNAKVGVGYNFGNISDDLTDLTQDEQGIFVNVIAKF
ncbi:hypothetical protein SAMN04488515_1904 [Cognatiyoonia koreensis]|uniref:Outer membrane protein beta-barrel family protein n=1 Tax=Cognatiyoonia koreensis TaxID=364200 RepID=A0A1I0QGU8_9RHOB|nr:hypothetical protein [Cognatiyoonia koreensis]SEW26144.1 hypothetical protein SAMN04488515_1904 [Cognatiyoonia koreensis]